MKLFIRSLLSLFLAGLCLPALAHINPNDAEVNVPRDVTLRSDCAQATSQIDMNINNVRARLLNGGDVWWDLQDGKYIVPNVDPASGIPEVSSIFAGAVWIGGFDDVGNLKMAAQTYRSSTRTDFWPGPLTAVGTTAADTCLQWDRFFRVLGENIRTHLRAFNEARESGASLDCDAIPEDIRGWPGKGNPYFFEINGWTLPFDTQGLGAFHDEDNDGLYDPCQGDYPVIEVRGCNAPNFPDEMVFWIYNDNGNIHTNSQGDPIRMEVQVQAFAYATNDEINDMTFQRYKLINRATSIIDSTFFAMWIDPDLGCFTDDYIGCDVERSLMYVYNEDELDGTTGCDCPSGSGPVNTYCSEVPILGVDYFRGPRGPARFRDTFPFDWEFNPFNNGTPINQGYDIVQIFEDSTINLGNGFKIIVGEERVELGMSSFTYYMNGGVGNWPNAMTDPQAGAPLEFYRLISGSWKDGTPYSFGGSGYNIPPTQLIDYAFPNEPDDQAGWSMCTASLDFGDRRTLQATGPLRLDPGEVNELIIGAVWVPDMDYPCPEISRLLAADGLAQALFDNCFEVPDGPDAPDLDFIELDRELIVILSNDTLTSNNAFELYREKGLEIPPLTEDSTFVFEGYKVFQLSGPGVSASELDDIEKARLIIQVDVRNGVNSIYNWSSIPDPNPLSNEVIWIPEEMVSGGDEGIQHTFRILEDQFGSEDRRLVNHKKYYYMALAYGYNNYEQFDPQTIIGQRKPYLEGRRNIQVYDPIPRPIVYDCINSFYGEGAQVIGLNGIGAGGNFLDITEESRLEAVVTGCADELVYTPNMSPLEVKVFDPLRIKDGTYILEFNDNDGIEEQLASNARWILYPENDPSNIIRAERSIDFQNEQIMSQFGFTINIGQTEDVGDDPVANDDNGAIGGSFEYQDIDGPQWFGWIPDGFLAATFIGPIFNYVKTEDPDNPAFPKDPNSALSTIGGGIFVPFHLADFALSQANALGFIVSPTWMNNGQASVQSQQGAELQALNNVDIVFTSDKSLWSRCIVVETSNPFFNPFLTDPLSVEGSSRNMEIRDRLSVGKEDNDGDGAADPDGATDSNGNPLKGFGWFPGYAVDVETGKRLNIFFGENSVYSPEVQAVLPDYPANGRDMIWNPSADIVTANFTGLVPEVPIGGMHYVYVTKQEYDSCKVLAQDLRINGGIFNKFKGLPNITWAGMPILRPDAELLSYNDGLIPNDVLIKLRVDNPYDVEEDQNGTFQYPKYKIVFEAAEASKKESNEEINAALANINVVPNPYFGYSEYETAQFTNTVKITNLPDNCTVTIYSLDGRFIRQYNRNELGVLLTPPNRANAPIPQTQTIPAIEWDLRNSKGIPISSGVYLIHVDAPGLGERVLKWFGVNRKFDPAGL